jgi:DNA polymerase-1
LEKLLVDDSNFARAFSKLGYEKYIGFDTETYGLGIHDQAFAAQFAIQGSVFYFDLNSEEQRRETFERLAEIFADPSKVWFAHNAKFDLHRIYPYVGIPAGRVHCTQAVERLIFNQHQSYSLDACLKRRGRSKNNLVEAWIKENRAYTMEDIPGKKKRFKNKHYDQVPFDIMFEYGCDDAADVRWLGMDQRAAVNLSVEDSVYHRECLLVKTCLEMERTGVRVDPDYIQRGIDYESDRLDTAIRKATDEAGEEYRNGPKWLRAAFDKLGQSYDINPETQNPKFDKHALAGMQTPIAGTVREIRRAEKYIGTYYSSFDYYRCGSDNVLHASINQSGTDTGRFSYSDPNLQNVPKEEDFAEGSIQVRKCFIPREDYCFVMIDFDQQEFRLMLDYANERAVIHDIIDNGADVHQATADMVGVPRKQAKTLNFGLLYGMGVAKLAAALKISEAEAKHLRQVYFSKLPGVRRLIQDIQRTATSRGYIKTWAGRRIYFPDPEWAYKAPNHLIQGGCGDIAKHAMNELSAVLRPYRSNMLIQVHDEIVFEIHKDELEIVDQLRLTMENVYQPRNGMKLTCGVEHSWVSWGKQDVREGFPTASTETTTFP